MTDGRTSLTTTVGVIAGVHDRTADRRTDTLVSGLTCFTYLNGIVLDVADLTDGSLAIQTDPTDLAGRKSYLCHAVSLLGDQLSHSTCGADELRTLTGVDFDVVDNGTNGNVGDGQRVAGLNICVCAGVNDIPCSKSLGSDNIALGSLGILKQCDISGSVGVVLDTNDGVCVSILTLEVDDSLLDLVSAASVTDGDATVAVTACMLLLGYDQALFGSEFGDLLERRNGHVSSGRCCRLILNRRHSLFPPSH